MEENKNSGFISIISIIIIIAIIAYAIYSLYKDNSLLNSNDINNKISSINEPKYDLSNTQVDENVIAQKEIIYTDVEIANFTSTLFDNSENRVFNISKACEILNNTTILPGEEFSFNNTIGPMDESSGFKKATGFDSNGRLIQISGGGMCQVSSTLYNVALIANLEITERHPHSRRVSYVPAGKDATVFYPSLDLKFINNTDNELKITAENDNYSVIIKMYKKEQSN